MQPQKRFWSRFFKKEKALLSLSIPSPILQSNTYHKNKGPTLQYLNMQHSGVCLIWRDKLSLYVKEKQREYYKKEKEKKNSKLSSATKRLNLNKKEKRKVNGKPTRNRNER